MAATLDASLGTAKASASATTTLVTANAAAAGSTILVMYGRFNSGAQSSTVSVTTTGGLTWTQEHTTTSGSIRVSIFRAYAPNGLASGTTLVWTMSSGTGDSMLGAGSFLGLQDATAVAFNASAATSTAWTSGTVSANSGNMMFGGAFGDGAVTTSTPTSPAVELFDFNDATQNETCTGAYKLSVAGSDSIAGTFAASLSQIGIAVALLVAPDAVIADPWVGHRELGPGYGPNPFVEDIGQIVTTGAQTFNQALTATATTTSSFVNQVSKIVTATATSTASIVKSVGKVLTATVTSTATLAALKVILLTLTATVTTTATIVKQVNKFLTVTLPAATASIVKQVNKLLTATVTTTATVTAIKVILKALTATVTTTATMVRQVGKPLSAIATSTATLIKQVGKALTATMTSTATLNAIKVILRTLTATTVTTTATMTRRAGITLTATATTAGSIAKRVGKALAGAASSVASLVAQFFGPPTQDLYPTPFEYVEQKSSLSYTEPFMFAHSDQDATRYQEQTGLTYREPKKLMGN